MGNPLLSVTITNYNYGAYIERAIASILQQTWTDFEIIIVDNASTDNSVEIIRQAMARDSRIRLVTHEQNQGLNASLSEACSLARGTYRVHIDADDWVIDPQAFELQIAMLESDPTIAFVYSPIALYNNDEQCVLVRGPMSKDGVVPGEWAVYHALMVWVMNSGPMHRMSAYRAFGGYNPEFYHAVDMKLAIDLCGQGNVGYINRPLYAFYQHPVSLSRSATTTQKQLEALKAIETAFTGPLAGKIARPAWMRRRAIQNCLMHHPTQRIFSGHYRSGWWAYWCSFKLMPYETVFQKRTVSLVVRTVLGNKGYLLLKQAVQRFKGRQRRRAAVASTTISS